MKDILKMYSLTSFFPDEKALFSKKYKLLLLLCYEDWRANIFQCYNSWWYHIHLNAPQIIF